MEPSLNLWTIIILMASGHGILLSLLLFMHKRGDRTANRILSALIFVFSLRLLEVVAIWTKYILEVPYLFTATASFKYLYGPLLYFYAKSVTQGIRFNKRYLWHFVPFVIHALIHIPLYLTSRAYKIDLLTNYVLIDNPPISFSWDPYFIFALSQLPHLIFYSFLTWQVIKRYEQTINSSSLTLEKIKLAWLRKLLAGFGGLWGLWLFYTIAITLGTRYYVELDYIVTGSVSLIVFAIAYMTFKQPEIVSDGLMLKRLPRYEKSTLTPDQANIYAEKLVSLMEREELFRKSDLNLAFLAGELSISAHHLSQILNEQLQQNFNDFINRYRVQEAQKRLSDPDENRTTILEIAYDVGFNNKASFNAAFKKHVGLTPTQFKKSKQLSS